MKCVTVLGCGPSPGVPLIGNRWGACDPKNPKNRRTRSSILLQIHGKNILIDSSPDLRQQLLREDIDRIDAVLYTHAHADHAHGINDLFYLGRSQNQEIPVYADPETLKELLVSFPYMFSKTAQKGAYYKPSLIPNIIEGGRFVLFEKYPILHFEQDHGYSKTYGFRFESFAYSTDLISMPETSWKMLEGIKIWMVSALRLMPHETHAHLDLVLSWVERLNPQRTYLTHLGTEMDFDAVTRQLPDNVFLCYDGLKIDL
jgi:phosphoribosyl 1,2-cyclic phosphate phosphodiesterase